MLTDRGIEMRTLRRGDTIAIVAPAGAIDGTILHRAVQLIEAEGFGVRVMPHVEHCATGVFAAPDALRAEDLQRAIDDDSIAAIICARGGYGTVRIIDRIDLGRLVQKPKWIVGFSDITVLHARLTQLGIPSVHGPMLKHIATHTFAHPDNRILLQTLTTGTPPRVSVATHPLSVAGTATGTLTGGNLSLLYALRGTDIDIRPSGKILFVEDLCEYNYHIDRMMQNLKMSRILQQINGLIAGQFTDIKDGATPFGQNAYETIRDAVGASMPTLMGFEAGHNPDVNTPLVFGAKVRLTIGHHTSTLEYL